MSAHLLEKCSKAKDNNTNSITVDYSTTATSGVITVKGTNACGNGTVSTNYAVTVNPLPIAAGTITGTATVCQGQSGVAYSVPAITNATGYVWTLPAGATIATGNNTNDLKKEFPELKGFSPRNLLYMKQFAEAYPVSILERFIYVEQELKEMKSMRLSHK